MADSDESQIMSPDSWQLNADLALTAYRLLTATISDDRAAILATLNPESSDNLRMLCGWLALHLGAYVELEAGSTANALSDLAESRERVVQMLAEGPS